MSWGEDKKILSKKEDDSISDKYEEPEAKSKWGCPIGSYEAQEKGLGKRHWHENFSFNYY